MLTLSPRRSHDYPAPVDPWLREELNRLRYRGHRGGFIPKHRALLFSPFDASKWSTAALLMVGFLVVWYLLLDLVTRFWGAVLDFWASVLGFGGVVGMIHYRLFGLIPFSVPDLYVPAGLPGTGTWWAGVVFLIVLLAGSFLLSPRYLPVAYLLWVLALFQGCAQLFFAFWAEYFPYTASGYLLTVLLASLALISIVPIVLALTYYVFDFGPARSIALTALMMGHLTVLVPFQYSLHAFILNRTSLLFMPLLFLAVGLPLGVLVFIAFYGWGFSWSHRLRDQQVQWKVRRRFV
jgi:hypothetical protein